MPCSAEPCCVLAEKEEIEHPNNSFSPCSIHDRKCLQKQQAKRINNGNKMRSSGSPHHREESRPIVSTGGAPGQEGGWQTVGLRGGGGMQCPAVSSAPPPCRHRARVRASCTARWSDWRPHRHGHTRISTSSPSPTATATATSTPSRWAGRGAAWRGRSAGLGGAAGAGFQWELQKPPALSRLHGHSLKLYPLLVSPGAGWAAGQVLVRGPQDGGEAAGLPGAEGGLGLPPASGQHVSVSAAGPPAGAVEERGHIC